MKVIVPIKQVYDPKTVRVSRSRGMLDIRNAEFMMNPGDRYPLEEALKLKDEHGAQVVAITMGPPEAEDILREALAMNVDEAVLLCDEAFSEVDVFGAVMVVGKGIERVGEYDLILTGYKASGDGTGEFGPRLAEYLDLPQITRASQLGVDGGNVRARHNVSDGYVLMEASLPALLSIDERANRPRYGTLPGSIAAYDERTVTIWGAEDLGLTSEELAGSSFTEVRETFAGPERVIGRVTTGEPGEAARELLQELKARGYCHARGQLGE
jgi:electron transfer flavoprotein beta subunit